MPLARDPNNAKSVASPRRPHIVIYLEALRLEMQAILSIGMICPISNRWALVKGGHMPWGEGKSYALWFNGTLGRRPCIFL